MRDRSDDPKALLFSFSCFPYNCDPPLLIFEKSMSHLVDPIEVSAKREGNYDMICMGSHYSAHALRQLYMPNVTAEVAESAHCPVLTVRHMPK
jgi:hypothetical protein